MENNTNTKEEEKSTQEREDRLLRFIACTMMFNFSGEDHETTIDSERQLQYNHSFVPTELVSSPNIVTKNTLMFPPSQHEESNRKLMNNLGMTGKNKRRSYNSRVMLPDMKIGNVVSPNVYGKPATSEDDDVPNKHQDKKRRVSLNNDEKYGVNHADLVIPAKDPSRCKDHYRMEAAKNLREFLINLSLCERSDRDYLVDNLIAGVKNAFHSTSASCESSDEKDTVAHALERKDSIRRGKQHQSMLIRLDSRSNPNDRTQRCVITTETPTSSSPTTMTVSASVPVNVPSRNNFSPERCERSTFEIALNQQVEQDTILPYDHGMIKDINNSPKSAPSSRERCDISAFEVGIKQEVEQDLIRPNDDDVIGGRGNGPKNHDGNIAFRNLVQKYKIDYINAYTSRDKRSIVKQIIAEVGQKGGRFLKKEYNDKAMIWKEMDENSILIKVAQALRENAPDLKRRHGGSPQYQLEAASALMSLGSK